MPKKKHIQSRVVSMATMKRTVPTNLFLLPLCVLVLIGCQDAETPKPGPAQDIHGELGTGTGQNDERAGSAANKDKLTHVIATETVYYKTGPQQGRPPDGTFKAGTKVTVIEKAGSYSLVRSGDGIEAYVASDALKKLEQRAIPAGD